MVSVITVYIGMSAEQARAREPVPIPCDEIEERCVENQGHMSRVLIPSLLIGGEMADAGYCEQRLAWFWKASTVDGRVFTAGSSDRRSIGTVVPAGGSRRN